MKQQQKPKIYLVGIGMGNPDTITVAGQKAIAQSDCIIGAKRMLAAFAQEHTIQKEAIYEQEIVDYIIAHPEFQTISVLVSGDVGFYSGAKKLVQRLEDYDTELICGISSVVYFCAKLKLPWDDVRLVSAHGRECQVIAELKQHAKVFLLTGGKETVSTICETLCANGFGNAKVYVGERLSYEDESISMGTAAELQHGNFASLSVMLIERPQNWPVPVITHGLPDEAFDRAEVPMTKSEVRSIAISKMQLKATDIVYDVGAGTGSVAIEAALQVCQGQVYAVEKNPAALTLLAQNQQKFAATNLQIIAGAAPAALQELPAPNVVFVGGSTGHLREILQTVLQKNPAVRIVINAIALETLAEAVACCQTFALADQEIIQVAITKTRQIAHYHMLTGQNPIFIISGRGNGNAVE